MMRFFEKRPPLFVLCLSGAASALLLCACPPPVEKPDLNGGFAYGKVSAFIGGSPIEGAEVCVHTTDLCTSADSDGQFELEGLEENVDIVLSFDHRDFFPAIGMWNTARKDDAWSYTLPKEGELGLQVGFADKEIVRGLGQVFFAARVAKGSDKDGVPDIVLNGDAALGTPVYSNGLGLPDVAVTETSGAGNAIYINVEPGEYSFGIEGVDCEPYFSMDKNADGEYPVHIFENTLSAVTVFCES